MRVLIALLLAGNAVLAWLCYRQLERIYAGRLPIVQRSAGGETHTYYVQHGRCCP